jgi:ABC-type transport system involved in multi-copper enzyme maturation permease subunit
MMALGLAAIIRHTAGAITGLVAVVFIIPIVTQLLPDSIQRDFARYLPANAGSAITNVVQTSDSLGPWTGYAVFLGWVAIVIGIGYYMLRKRDV